MLLVSEGRFALRNGRNSIFSANTPVSRSYRSPRFSVRRRLMTQSSCAHPAYTFRGEYCFQPPTPTTYFLEIEESDAMFHVDTSMRLGNRLSMFAGIGPPWASRMPLQRLHTNIQVMSYRYSPPTFRSWRPPLLYEHEKSSRTEQSSL